MGNLSQDELEDRLTDGTITDVEMLVLDGTDTVDADFVQDKLVNADGTLKDGWAADMTNTITVGSQTYVEVTSADPATDAITVFVESTRVDTTI